MLLKLNLPVSLTYSFYLEIVYVAHIIYHLGSADLHSSWEAQACL